MTGVRAGDNNAAGTTKAVETAAGLPLDEGTLGGAQEGGGGLEDLETNGHGRTAAAPVPPPPAPAATVATKLTPAAGPPAASSGDCRRIWEFHASERLSARERGLQPNKHPVQQAPLQVTVYLCRALGLARCREHPVQQPPLQVTAVYVDVVCLVGHVSGYMLSSADERAPPRRACPCFIYFYFFAVAAAAPSCLSPCYVPSWTSMLWGFCSRGEGCRVPYRAPEHASPDALSLLLCLDESDIARQPKACG